MTVQRAESGVPRATQMARTTETTEATQTTQTARGARLGRRRAVLGGTTLVAGAVLTACAPGQNAPESAPAAPTVIQGTPRPLATAASGVPTTGGVVPTPRNQTVVIDQTVFQVFDSFNPYIPNGQQYQAGYIQAAKEYLFYANFAAGKIEPHLATAWKYNADFTELTLSLNPRAKWNDGQPFTAQDVRFTIEMLQKNPSLLSGADVRRFVGSMETPNPQTLVIRLTQANPRFHYVFICGIVSGFEVVPQHVWSKVDPTTFKDNPPVRTGPYKLDRVIPEQFMFVWKKDPNYWNRANEDFKPEYIVYRSSPVVDSAMEEFKRGYSDMVSHGQVTYTHMKSMMDGGYKPMQIVTRFRDPCPRGIRINNDPSKGILGDARGRWAVSYLLDRDKIGSNVWLMKTPPAQFPWADYKSNSQWETASIANNYKLTYDPRKAAQMLDEMGARAGADGKRSYQGKPVEIEVMTPALVGGPEHAIAELLAGEMNKIGIDATARAYTGTVHTTKLLTGDYDMTSAWLCGADFDPNRLLTTYQSSRAVPIGQSTANANEERVRDAALDEITRQLDVSDPTGTNSKPLFDKALEAYYKALPTIPIIQTTYPVGTNTTYWTGWPTDNDLYQVPLGWWGQFRFVLAKLKPTGAR